MGYKTMTNMYYTSDEEEEDGQQAQADGQAAEGKDGGLHDHLYPQQVRQSDQARLMDGRSPMPPPPSFLLVGVQRRTRRRRSRSERSGCA